MGCCDQFQALSCHLQKSGCAPQREPGSRHGLRYAVDSHSNVVEWSSLVASERLMLCQVHSAHDPSTHFQSSCLGPSSSNMTGNPSFAWLHTLVGLWHPSCQHALHKTMLSTSYALWVLHHSPHQVPDLSAAVVFCYVDDESTVVSGPLP